MQLCIQRECSPGAEANEQGPGNRVHNNAGGKNQCRVSQQAFGPFCARLPRV